MRLLYLLPLLLVAACSIEDRIERREDRLTGSWQIERAFFKENDELFRDDITADFAGDRITFFPDFTLTYAAGNGEVFEGFWRINALREVDNDLEFTIDADFFDFRGRLAFQWLGTIDKLTNNNFNIDVAERNGVLRLRWDRL